MGNLPFFNQWSRMCQKCRVQSVNLLSSEVVLAPIFAGGCLSLLHQFYGVRDGCQNSCSRTPTWKKTGEEKRACISVYWTNRVQLLNGSLLQRIYHPVQRGVKFIVKSESDIILSLSENNLKILVFTRVYSAAVPLFLHGRLFLTCTLIHRLYHGGNSIPKHRDLHEVKDKEKI